jgi:hypothetical protein
MSLGSQNFVNNLYRAFAFEAHPPQNESHTINAYLCGLLSFLETYVLEGYVAATLVKMLPS